LNGLDSLTSVVGSFLSIYNNDALTSLNGLKNLTSVSGNLMITNNDVLTNLCALYNVILYGNLNIYDNLELSMETAYVLETQLRSNGFIGTADIRDNSGSGQVFCDYDGDTVNDDIDNCPKIANPCQEDIDANGIGDICDANAIYGAISGDVQENFTVSLYKINCGIEILVATTTTDENGYYSFGVLENRRYLVEASEEGYTFVPQHSWVNIPQEIIQSYDFHTSCNGVNRFSDNLDGTVTDCRTGLIWLQNANCYGGQTWDNATTKADRLNDGECGLSDGSIAGDWWLPTKEELQGIGTDPPATWGSGSPLVTWAMPDAPFVNVSSGIYWSSTEYSLTVAWRIDMSDGVTGSTHKFHDGYLLWPVRSTDRDGDGLDDHADNCPDTCNAQQSDADGDYIGDVCDETPGCGGCGQATCEQEC
jgi:hypothetical protein